MSADIRQQIRELAEFHQSSRQSVELHEVQEVTSRAGKVIPRRVLRGPALAVTVMITILVVAGGVALVFSNSEETPPADTVTPTTLVVPTTVSPTATIVVVPTTVSSSPSTTVPGDLSMGATDLVWQRLEPDDIPGDIGGSLVVDSTVFDGGDRFVLLRGAESLTSITTSFDGVSWLTRPVDNVGYATDGVAWEDTVLVAGGGGGWSLEENGPVFSSPSVVSVIHPEGTVDRQVFDGDVLSAAVGPAGMFVTLHPHGSYGAVIDQILGPGFSDTLYEAEVRDGVLTVRAEPDNETIEIVLSEHGLTEEDLNSPVAAWYSESGSEWIPVPDAPGDLNVVGTTDGFVGVAGATAWHSDNGLEWSHLGELPFVPGPLHRPMRWRQGVVVTDLSHYAYISADGIEPLTAPPVALSSPQRVPLPLYLSGDLGVIVVNPVEKELFFTRDGEDWVVGTLPDEMTDGSGWHYSSGAVSSEAVLLLLWEEETPGGVQQPVWWLGTLSEE